MPDSDVILKGLSEIANEGKWLAMLWHVYFGALAGLLFFGKFPSRRWAAILFVFPLVSVSSLAFSVANVFNGTVFALLSLIVLIAALKVPNEKVRLSPSWARTAGGFMILFGWLYPHFLEGEPLLSYFYLAPTGLLPCPTLSILSGFALCLNGLDSKVISVALLLAGVFYGLFGFFVLGVGIDFILFFGALALALEQILTGYEKQTMLKA